MSVEDLADEAAIEPEAAAEAMTHFETMGMVHREGDVWCVTNWGSYQYESDNSAERVARHRARKRAATAGNADVTLHDRSSNGAVTPPDNRVQSTDVDDADTRARAREAGQELAAEEREALRLLETDLLTWHGSKTIRDSLYDFAAELGWPVVLEGMRRTIAGSPGRSWKYCRSILSSWAERRVRSPTDIAALDAAFEAQRQAAAGAASGRAGPGRRRVPQGMASLAALYAQAKAEEEGQPP